MIEEDAMIRDWLNQRLKGAAVAKLDIERAGNKVKAIIHSARPGIVIGKKGVGIDSIRIDLQNAINNKRPKNDQAKIFINVVELRKPETDAKLIAENIAEQLIKRVAFRRAMKRVMLQAFKFGVKGIRVRCSGRLAGAEIARAEWYAENSVPLHTIRADIDYATAEAKTTYGIIGIKVWVYKGDILGKKELKEETTTTT